MSLYNHNQYSTAVTQQSQLYNIIISVGNFTQCCSL